MKCNHANELNHQTQAINANTKRKHQTLTLNANTQRNLSTQALMGATRLASGKCNVYTWNSLCLNARRETRRPH